MLEKAVELQSPIEFALIGPQRSRDRVLVRSSNAGIDLIGLAAGTEPFEKPTPRGLTDWLWNTRQLNIIQSKPVSDVGSDADTRNSKFRFVWIGRASASGIRDVERALNIHLVDLHYALKDEDAEGVELALAPVVYSCVKASEKLLRSRRLIFLASVVVVLYVISVAVYSALEKAKYAP
jgi:hypothetical protein